MATITSLHDFNPGAQAIMETQEVLQSDIGHEGAIALTGGNTIPWRVTVTDVPARHVARVVALIQDWEPNTVSIDY